MSHHRDLTTFFSSEGPSTPFSIVILNQPINVKAYDALAHHAKHIILADGGANRLLSLTSKSSKPHRLPTAIVGDLDSINPSTLTHYQSLGIPIHQDPDQYSTDFTKSLKHIRHLATVEQEEQQQQQQQQEDKANPPSFSSSSSSSTTTPPRPIDIIAFADLSGRLDQAFSLLHHLLASLDNPTWLYGDIYLLGLESFTLVLEPGHTVLQVGPVPSISLSHSQSAAAPPASASSSPPSSQHPPLLDPLQIISPEPIFAQNVGLLPLLGPTTITTRGLEWDVEDWPTEVGGQVSTSNHLREEQVEIWTPDRDGKGKRLLFTVELGERFNARVDG